jgi:hypothetical protein
MFIIYDTTDENNNRLVWGPKFWEKSEIQHFLYKKYNLNYTVPYQNPTEKIYEPKEGVKIWPVQYTEDPSYDAKTQYLHGPLFTFTETHAVQYHEVRDYEFNLIKSKYLDEFNARRKQIYNTDFFDFEIGEEVYSIQMNNSNRIAFANGIPGPWKLCKITITDPEEGTPDAYVDIDSSLSGSVPYSGNQVIEKKWVDLSQENLDNINAKIKDRLQLYFTIQQKVEEYVESCTTVEQLDNIPTRADTLVEFINDNMENTNITFE